MILPETGLTRVSLSWRNIAKRFEASFLAEGLTKKIHFDCCVSATGKAIVIDGVSVKWVDALLMDAMVCYFRNEYSPKACRRSFNQHFSFLKSVLDEFNLLKSSGRVTLCRDYGTPKNEFQVVVVESSSHQKYNESKD